MNSSHGSNHGKVHHIPAVTSILPTIFLAYAGGEETFYQKAFEYVLSSGLTGNIVGTMSSYEIGSSRKRKNLYKNGYRDVEEVIVDEYTIDEDVRIAEMNIGV